jgi:phosphopantetheinyl transferase (holo-ACP synthase)
MWTAWVDRAKAKKANNDTAATAAANAAKEAFTKFANTLSDGVVKQHPEMFPQI